MFLGWPPSTCWSTSCWLASNFNGHASQFGPVSSKKRRGIPCNTFSNSTCKSSTLGKAPTLETQRQRHFVKSKKICKFSVMSLNSKVRGSKGKAQSEIIRASGLPTQGPCLTSGILIRIPGEAFGQVHLVKVQRGPIEAARTGAAVRTHAARLCAGLGKRARVLPYGALTNGPVHFSTLLLPLADCIYLYPYNRKEPLANPGHCEHLCNSMMQINMCTFLIRPQM